MAMYYTPSPTFDDVFPTELTPEEYLSMVSDGYAIFTSEEECRDYLDKEPQL